MVFLIDNAIIIGGLVALNYFVWSHNAAMANDYYNNRPINPNDVPNSLNYYNNASRYMIYGGFAGAGCYCLCSLAAPTLFGILTWFGASGGGSVPVEVEESAGNAMLDEFEWSDIIQADLDRMADNLPEIEPESDFNLLPEPEVDPEAGTLNGWDSQETPPMGYPRL